MFFPAAQLGPEWGLRLVLQEESRSEAPPLVPQLVPQ